MNKALRKAVIAGNWKMNKTPAEAKELISAIAPLVKDGRCRHQHPDWCGELPMGEERRLHR